MEIKKYLVIPANGLGNRLRTIMAFVFLAEKEKSSVQVFWDPTQACPGTFDDNFAKIKNVEFIGKSTRSNRQILIVKKEARQ